MLLLLFFFLPLLQSHITTEKVNLSHWYKRKTSLVFLKRNIIQLNFQFSFPKILLLFCQFGYYKSKEFDFFFFPLAYPKEELHPFVTKNSSKLWFFWSWKIPQMSTPFSQVFSLDFIWLKWILPLSFTSGKLLVISGLYSERGKALILIKHLFYIRGIFWAFWKNGLMNSSIASWSKWKYLFYWGS